MTPAEHAAKAEALLSKVARTDVLTVGGATVDRILRFAQVHATLAVAYAGIGEALMFAAQEPPGEIKLDTPPGWKGTRSAPPPPVGPGCNCQPGMTWSCPRHGAVL